MRITYDPSVDAAYIYFKEGHPQVTTIRLTEDIAVDLGPNEEVFGIEILDASQHLGFKSGEPSVTLENLRAKRPNDSTQQKSQPNTLQVIRRRYPRAYERWTAEEERLLTKNFREGLSIPEVARLLQRQPGAIESRLRRLGLVQQ